MLKQIVAVDFIGDGAGGHTAGRKQMLTLPEGPSSFANVKMEELLVRVFGNTAVVRGKLTDFDVALHETVRFTMIYLDRGYAWKLAAAN